MTHDTLLVVNSIFYNTIYSHWNMMSGVENGKIESKQIYRICNASSTDYYI